VSLTSSDISVPSGWPGPGYIIFGEIGVKCSPAHQLRARSRSQTPLLGAWWVWERDWLGHARNLPAKQLIWRQLPNPGPTPEQTTFHAR
jgi:hypothetical protein